MQTRVDDATADDGSAVAYVPPSEAPADRRRMTPRDLYDFLSAQDLAVLATRSPAGPPQAALVGVAVTEGLELVFDTLRTSRKYANLVAEPRVALVLGWAGEVTVQYEGTARTLTGEDVEPYAAAYVRRFPDGRARRQWPEIAYVVVTPRWVRYTSYAGPTPYTEEFTFPAQADATAH